MIDIPCIILSGGASRRMGEDKSLLAFKGFDTLIEYQYHKLSKIFSHVYISSKINKFNFDANILYDNSLTNHSPMIALHSILSELEAEKVFIITVDVPFIEKDTFEVLVKKSSHSKITIAKDSTHSHNLCGVFSKTLLPTIRELLNNDIHKIRALINDSNDLQEILFTNNEQFINMNTREEYNKYKI